VTAWLDDEEMAAWRGLVDVLGDAMAGMEADLVDEHDLQSGDYGVLVQLSEAKDRRLRMCDLAERLHLSPSGLTRRLDGLVKAGYVAREPSPDDRRVSLAALTPAGMAKLRDAAPSHVASVRRHLLDHLSRPQIRQIAQAMRSLERGRSALAG
jgi:DNA-binding MarR family transcriptional regulator